MCTAVSFKTKDHYFGRNLDLEYTYDETVTVTPRRFPFSFRCAGALRSHYAMIGMATAADGYPLYYEATNEHGLSMAGLNFPGNAVFLPPDETKDNISPFEFIPWILGQCRTLGEARVRLERLNLVNIPFSRAFPLTPLHWMISDAGASVTVEPGADGLHIWDNPVGVLTNNPPFDYHMYNLCNYMGLTREEAVNRLCPALPLHPYSSGMGAIGLPGDLSSASRFIRASFTKLSSVCGETESESISQFFHILSSVAQQRGCAKVHGKYEITAYSCCCNTDKGIYYYKTYENSQITAVNLFHENLDSEKIRSFELVKGQQLREEN